MIKRLMNSNKEMHPGAFLDLLFKRRKIIKDLFAMAIKEDPAKLMAIVNGNERMNARLAKKIERALNLKAGILMRLQGFHDKKDRTKSISIRTIYALIG
jgi:plasmid maintenance system antidote protein VapI